MENKGKKSEFVMMEPPERKNLEDYTTDIRREIRCIVEGVNCRVCRYNGETKAESQTLFGFPPSAQHYERQTGRLSRSKGLKAVP